MFVGPSGSKVIGNVAANPVISVELKGEVSLNELNCCNDSHLKVRDTQNWIPVTVGPGPLGARPLPVTAGSWAA
jgi:hypothetical protein